MRIYFEFLELSRVIKGVCRREDFLLKFVIKSVEWLKINFY